MLECYMKERSLGFSANYLTDVTHIYCGRKIVLLGD